MKSSCAAAVALATVVLAAAAHAQGLETLGSRAPAMAAFVAVADDASAVAWNPAGFVSGPLFNINLGIGRQTTRPDDPPAFPARGGRTATTILAIGTTPLGLAYYRLATTSLRVNPAVVGTVDRQEGRVVAQTLTTSHLGATVQQSVGDVLTLGATLKLVRGSVGQTAEIVSTWSEALRQADTGGRDARTRGDVDLGAMAAAGRVRAGVVVRNLTAPDFGDENSRPARLDRHVRVGVAWGDGWPGLARTILALDVDATRVEHVAGARRDVAAGVERWFAAHRVGLRSGIRVSTIDEARPVASLGASYALRSGVYADAFLARGSASARAWGVAARVTY